MGTICFILHNVWKKKLRISRDQPYSQQDNIRELGQREKY